MRIPPKMARRIVQAFNETSTRLGPVTSVQARPNKRTLCSLRGSKLNIADAVVHAGPDAWKLVAPTLERNRTAKKKLVGLVEAGLRSAAHVKRVERGLPRRRATGLANTSCDGTKRERRTLNLYFQHWSQLAV